MNQMRMRLPRPLYYLLITAITELILAGGAGLILLPTGFLKQLPLGVLAFLVIYKTIIATIVLVVMSRNRWQDHLTLIKGGGYPLGSVVGLLLGGILGGRYGGLVWGIVGAMGVSMLVGWIGARLSLAIGNQLDRVYAPPEEAEGASSLQRARPTLLMVYAVVGPAVLVLIEAFLHSLGVSSSEYAEALPAARMVVIPLSLLTILLPWWMRSWRMVKPGTSLVARENAFFFVGLGSSLAPVIYGLLLFTAFGASIFELGMFALVSSLAAILWIANT